MTASETTIEKALDTMRPFLKKDGGDVELVSYVDNIVSLKLLGACGTCDISHLTMKAGLEEAIKKVLPDVLEVRAVN